MVELSRELSLWIRRYSFGILYSIEIIMSWFFGLMSSRVLLHHVLMFERSKLLNSKWMGIILMHVKMIIIFFASPNLVIKFKINGDIWNMIGYIPLGTREDPNITFLSIFKVHWSQSGTMMILKF
jgi:hypothetical protein